MVEMVETTKQRRGFAAMDPDKQREIAAKGGRAAHEKGSAHEYTPDEARAAGKKGGAAVAEIHGSEHMADIGSRGGATVSRDRKWMAEIGRRGGAAVSRNREHMSEIGRKGGSARHVEPSEGAR